MLCCATTATRCAAIRGYGSTTTVRAERVVVVQLVQVQRRLRAYLHPRPFPRHGRRSHRHRPEGKPACMATRTEAKTKETTTATEYVQQHSRHVCRRIRMAWRFWSIYTGGRAGVYANGV